MNIQGAALYRYDLPLIRPLLIAGKPLTRRRGFLIEITLPDGVRYGEVAPLPGYSPVDSETSEHFALDALKKLLSHRPLMDQPLPLPEDDWYSLPPSVRCGLSMALCPIVSPEGAAKDLGLTALLSGSPIEAIDRAEQLAEAGYASFKLKVGHISPEGDRRLVASVRSAIGPGPVLRLDANRAWDLPTALAFAESVAPHDIAYIEEPLQKTRHLREYAEQGAIPYALDESVAQDLSRLFEWRVREGSSSGDTPPRTLGLLQHARAIIVKPTCTGEFHRLPLFPLRFPELQAEWVVSACFESGLGMGGLVRLAGAMPDAHRWAGLDTYGWLGADVMRDRLPLDTPRLDPSDPVWSRGPDTSKLEEIWRG